MPTYTFYGQAADGDVYGTGATDAGARGSGFALTNGNSSAVLNFGQEKSGATYYSYEAFISFDSSSVIGTPTSVTLSLYIDNDQTATDFTMYAAVYDWGTSVAVADFVPAASMSGLTLRASMATSAITLNAYNDFTSEASFLTNCVGTVRLLLYSSRQQSGGTPTGKEYVGVQSGDAANPPKLTIVTPGGDQIWQRRRPTGLYVR